MTVKLRVAGIYYEQEFAFADLTPVPAFAIPGRVPLTAPPGSAPVTTIFELLEAAYNNPGLNKTNFIYVFERRVRPGAETGVNNFLSITSLGVTHTVDINPSLGEKFRAKGSYQLTEIAIPGGVSAWQYYVYRNGRSVSQLNPGGGSGFSPPRGNGSGFTGFDQFALLDGDEVIFRQVAILRGPSQPS